MSSEEKLSWDFIKEVAETLDSYKVRALIDAKEDILNAGIYNEDQYYTILFKLFDEERLKYSLLNYLKQSSYGTFGNIKDFAQLQSIPVKKAFSSLNLLFYENLVKIEEHFDEIEEEKDKPPKKIFKEISIEVYKGVISQIRSIYEPVKTIFDSHNCSGCGMCAGICPVNCLNILNGFGQFEEEKCIRCGLCYYVCPRSYLPVRALYMDQDNCSEIKEYSKVGHYIEAYSARTKVEAIQNVCQDGGISSTCLYHLLSSQKIDLALGAKMSNTMWRPEPMIIITQEDILETAGTKYVNNPTLRVLNQKELMNKRLAVVGVPCMMQALYKSQIYDIGIPSLANIEYKIGIFCMESFPYQGFIKICELLNVKPEDIKKTDINKGKFYIYTKSGEELTVPIKEISNLAREDCEVCFDLTSESADISVGSIGSPSGWNTVLIRTEKGKALYEELISNNLIESKNLEEVKPGLPLLLRISGIKRNVAKKHINSKKEKKIRYPKY
ncbi:MAG: Coenzyme F420 hydrogenase/dehydrogenase, beta subunit C-terminal domain [Promethearchaeota archaeon]